MKNLFFAIAFLTSIFSAAQNVVLSKVVQVHEDKDQFFYRIDSTQVGAEYLGDLEVHGFSDDDAEVFSKVYRKAKEIGANAFSYDPFPTIEDTPSKFDPWNYRLRLYYLPSQNFQKEHNTVYIFAPSRDKQKISFSGETINLEPRTFTKRTMLSGDTQTLSTRKIFGSSIRLSAKANQPAQYFQVLSANIKSGNEANPGLILKSGDIVALEKSFADFLSVIYTQF